MHRILPLILLTLCLAAPAYTAARDRNFSENEYRAHLEFLSSDLLEGRATGSRGARVAAAYLAARFQSLGLTPGGDRGTFFQSITFDGYDSNEKEMRVELINSAGSHAIEPVSEICMVSEQSETSVMKLAGKLWFVGYGITAPEYDWDDFKTFDPKGRIIVCLVNDPDPETGFADESMTYYGRWTYKIEMARRRGARALIMVHTDPEATYGWNVVQTSWTGERIAFHESRSHNLDAVAWIRHTALNRALQPLNLDYDKLKSMAGSRDFQPFPLKTDIKAEFAQVHRTFECANVIGILPGRDPELKHEAVIFTAHYDHLGRGMVDDTGDDIYNGALDNASGTAAVLCLARAFARAPVAPRRTLVFMPVTGEELGLPGSTWYARHPVMPLDRTAVVINKDCMNHFGRRKEFSAFPTEYSSALEAVRRIGKGLELELKTHSVDRGGGAFRSDHFPFAARGVSALSVGMRGDFTDLTADEVKAVRQKIGPTYHRPCDEVHPLWRYDGVLQELELLYRLGRHWADGAPKPRLETERENPFTATRRWYGISSD
ncbi:MAG TPA: M28 family peptidase [Candidatus Aminicenantes bacterium]|nr:M28 family peptidase [Candidatus Aminicenantes bacterium]